MIKRLIGIIVVVAVVIIVVVAAVRRDNFRSMVERDEVMDEIPGPVPKDWPDAQQSDPADSTTVTVTDSVRVEVVDSI
ncbi:hypothetical protein [Alistipes sp.]|uniref:hypothetical protein n=1 Tax=Alistipes sp. TaxID=1872444 RepID=UPI003AF1563C